MRTLKGLKFVNHKIMYILTFPIFFSRKPHFSLKLSNRSISCYHLREILYIYIFNVKDTTEIIYF